MLPTKTTSFKLPKTLFNVCRTTYERRVLFDEFQLIEKYIYTDKSVDINGFIKENVRDSTREIVIEVLGSEPKLYAERIKGFKDTVASLPLVELTIAVEPTANLVERLWQKTFLAVRSPFLLALRFDSWLLGGAVVSYLGKYGDFSLKAKVDSL